MMFYCHSEQVWTFLLKQLQIGSVHTEAHRSECLYTCLEQDTAALRWGWDRWRWKKVKTVRKCSMKSLVTCYRHHEWQVVGIINLHSCLLPSNHLLLSLHFCFSFWTGSHSYILNHILLFRNVIILFDDDQLMLCQQGRFPLQSRMFTLWTWAVSTCSRWTAAAVARPQAQSWTLRTWDTYVLLLQLDEDHRLFVTLYF